MRKRLPQASDVRAAIADARRALEAATHPVPASVERAAWTRADHGTCSFCGEEGPVVRAGATAICDHSLADLAHAASLPAGPHVQQVLATVERWMAAVPGEEGPEPWHATAATCFACGRAAKDLPLLIGSESLAICSDCVARAAKLADPVTRDHFEAGEADAALHELEDLERLQTSQGNTSLRANPSLALSLIRLLSIHDERVHERLATVIRALDT